MKRILRRLLKPAPQPTPAIRLPAEIRSIDDTDERDIFLAGYPKSGNTWMQCCVAALIYGFDIRWTPDALVQTMIPDVHFRPNYLRFRDPTCFKTHHFPRPEYKRVIYIVRDGRDVMTSYFHHLNDSDASDVGVWESVVIDGKNLGHGRWHEHVQAWENNKFDAEILTIRYEDLKTSTIATLEKIATFIGVDRTADEFEQVALTTTFASMSQREKDLRWANESWPEDKPFIRRGVVGSFRDEMPPSILFRFEQEAGAILSRLGYSKT